MYQSIRYVPMIWQIGVKIDNHCFLAWSYLPSMMVLKIAIPWKISFICLSSFQNIKLIHFHLMLPSFAFMFVLSSHNTKYHFCWAFDFLLKCICLLTIFCRQNGHRFVHFVYFYLSCTGKYTQLWPDN